MFSATVPVYAIDQISIGIEQLQTDELQIDDISLRTVSIPGDHGALSLSASAQIGNTAFKAMGQLDARQWQADITTHVTGPELVGLQQLFNKELSSIEIQGDTQISARINGDPDRILKGVSFQMIARQWTAELPDITMATEQADFTISGDVTLAKGQEYRGNIRLQLDSGLFAVGDFIIEPTMGVIDLSAPFIYHDDKLTLRDGRLHDPGGLSVRVPLLQYDMERKSPLSEVKIDIEEARFPYVYTAWAQGLLYGTLLADVETDGMVQGSLVLHGKEVEAMSLKLQDFSLSDKGNRFALYRANGNFISHKGLHNGRVSLKWDAAEIYRLDIGQSGLAFRIQENDAVLEEPFSLPLYDGELKVFEINIDHIAQDDMSVLFDGVLTPVSLSQITTALDWPKFSGTLSGVIPGIHYAKGRISIDGVLLARAFDGALKIHHLDIENLLGIVPRLSADIELENFDLELLTSTFDFGRIEGRLSGYVNGLKMVDWKPSQFDAFFYTPEGDKSRHRISQRAVDNLTSLSGSDIGSVLSRTYLRFLDNFRYDKLGIGCKLQNNVCQMRGIEPTSETGYYIVKAGFLPPRMDIIGYSTQVDWPELLARLQRVTSDKSPLIQ